MFPVLVSVHNAEDLKKVYELLGDGPAAGAAAPATTTTKKKAAAAATTTTAPATPAAQAPAPAPTPTPAPAPAPAPAAASTGISPEGQSFLQNKLAGPVMELCLKDQPKMEAILKPYGVERVSLAPESAFPAILAAVQEALDPGAAERKRLETLDKKRSLI